MKLNENYRIVFDENNVILQYFEKRNREKKDGTTEQYEYQSNTYHGSVKKALMAFLSKNLVGVESAEDCLRRINEVEAAINSLEGIPEGR